MFLYSLNLSILDGREVCIENYIDGFVVATGGPWILRFERPED